MSEIYPNAPLVEAIFEIRFPGEPRVECQRDRFYDLVRQEYPIVLIPPTKHGGHAALDPYRFEKEDGSAGFMIGIDKFAFYAHQYLGYRQFSEHAKDWIHRFSDLYNISRLKRTGLRYVNIIQFSRESGIIPLNHLFRISFNLPKIFPVGFENFSFTFVSKTEGGSITTKIESIVSSDQSKEAILLDFDYGKTENLSIESVDQYLEESHTYTKRVFEELISDEYMQYMRGEIL